MRLSNSWTRLQYEHAYRVMRRESEALGTHRLDGIPNEIIKAADYSYQANGYNFTGWVNDRRFIKFFNAMQGNRYSIWSIPF